MSDKFPGTYSHFRTEELMLFGFGDEENDTDIDCIKLKASYGNEERERYVQLHITVECQFQERASGYKDLGSELCRDGWYEMPLNKHGGYWLLRWFKSIEDYPSEMTADAIVQKSLIEMHDFVQEYVDQEETYYLE